MLKVERSGWEGGKEEDSRGRVQKQAGFLEGPRARKEGSLQHRSSSIHFPSSSCPAHPESITASTVWPSPPPGP